MAERQNQPYPHADRSGDTGWQCGTPSTARLKAAASSAASEPGRDRLTARTVTMLRASRGEPVCVGEPRRRYTASLLVEPGEIPA